jgi:Domain of unknown function (DUF3291)
VADPRRSDVRGGRSDPKRSSLWHDRADAALRTLPTRIAGTDVTGYDIAQLNVGRIVAPIDDARLADFVGLLDEINTLAERSPGFVWRLQGENGNNTSLKVSADPLFIVNLSVWESVEQLHAFTYASGHKSVFARRFDWFGRREGPNHVMWWLPKGTIPDVTDALRRLERLAELGPTRTAFTFKDRFPPPAAVDAAAATT